MPVPVSHRNRYINRFIEAYIDHWSVNLGVATGGKYEDHPNTTLRIMARSLAETIYDMDEGVDDESP